MAVVQGLQHPDRDMSEIGRSDMTSKLAWTSAQRSIGISTSFRSEEGRREVSIDGKVCAIQTWNVVTVPTGAHHNLNLWVQAGADDIARRPVRGIHPISRLDMDQHSTGIGALDLEAGFGLPFWRGLASSALRCGRGRAHPFSRAPAECSSQKSRTRHETQSTRLP